MRLCHKWTLAAVAVVWLAGTGWALSAPVIRIDAGQVTGYVEPLIYGQNIEAWDSRITVNTPKSRKVNEIAGTASGYWSPEKRSAQPAALEVMKQLKCRMLRYPGGCLVHNYDWRVTVGPVEERPNWQFGLDEFMALCEQSGAEPLITFTDYLLPPEELPQHLADMVEYLNAPARPEFPQALKRAKNGHAEPYGVRYFEIGNESYHPNHNLKPARSFTPMGYVKFAREVMRAVRAVDPSVQIGVVCEGLGLGTMPGEWDAAVYRELLTEADFVAHHLYTPRLDRLNADEVITSVGFAGDSIRYRLENARRHMRELGGVELPVALTEFNASGVQNKPVCWRFSYAAGLNLCETLMQIRKPEHKIMMAAYWQTIGGYFGAVKIDRAGQAQYNAVWTFLNAFVQHTGEELLAVEVEDNPLRTCRATKPGQPSVQADRFIPVSESEKIQRCDLFFNTLKKVNCAGSGDLRHLRFEFSGCAKSGYPDIMTIGIPEKLKGSSFLISADFEARFTPAADNEGRAMLGFGLMDSRGYAATRLAQAVCGMDKAHEWTKFSCPALSLGADTPAVTGLIRVEQVEGTLSGVLEIRNMRFTVQAPAQIPASATLGVEASRSGDTLYMVVVNRANQPVKGVGVEVTGGSLPPAGGKVRELHQDDVTVIRQFPVVEKPLPPMESGRFSWDFPPFSATFFEFSCSRRGQGKEQPQ